MPRFLVMASLPSRCTVCAGGGRVRIVRGIAPLTGSHHGQTTRCPHCHDQLPIAHLPMRTDHPRNDAA